MDSNKFKEVMAILAESYNREVSPVTAKVYWQCLKDFTNEQVEKAVIDYISDEASCQYWPQPGMLKAKITGTSKQQQISVESRAIEAWGAAYKAMMKHGQYQRLELEDKLALKVIQHMGGWANFCLMRNDEEQWRRKEFIECYKTLNGAASLPDSLPGLGDGRQEKLEGQKALAGIFAKVENMKGAEND